jgi:hypothetical protein
MRNATSSSTGTNADATIDGGETNTREAAQGYITRGWQPVPIPKGQKGPILPGWEDVSFGLSHFSPTQNIGVVLDKSGLTEVDYDCEEAAFVGGRKLPDTLEAGRGGRLRKAFYSTTLDKVYRDIGGYEGGKLKPGAKLLEIRCKNKQAVVYPSIHPSGERYEWLNESEPQQVDADELERLCDRVAASALIARHLPNSGRHDLAMAYAGFLLRKGLSQKDILDSIFYPAWEYHNAPAEAYDDLSGIVSDTAKKIAKDEPATGGNTLTKLIPGMTDALCDIFDWEQAPTPEEKAEKERQEKVRKAQEAWADPRVQSIAKSPDILDRFYKESKAAGHVGEERTLKVLYVGLTSRFLGRPMSTIVKGTSSTGKNHAVEAVLRTLPDSEYVAYTSMSEKAPIYDANDYRHKFLYIAEAEGVNNKNLDYTVRSLMSEGRIRYITVEKVNGEMKPREIEKEGPTGLVMTTTRANLYHDNETRAISVTVNDTRDQTKAIMRSIAGEDERAPKDWEPWRKFQTWLAAQIHEVWVPYAGGLAELVEAHHVRQRRDFKLLLNAIRTIAIIHQHRRDRDYKGRVVADYRDYEMARDLLNDLLSEGIGATVSKAIRETVAAVKALTDDADPVREHVPVKDVGDHLQLDKSAAARRVSKALADGYVVDLQEEGKRGKKLAVGSPMPEDMELLPEAFLLASEHFEEFSCTVARVSGGRGMHEIGRALMGTLVARTVARLPATNRLVAPLQKTPQVSDFGVDGLDKPNPDHEGGAEGDQAGEGDVPSDSRATVQLSYKVPENATNPEPDGATKTDGATNDATKVPDDVLLHVTALDYITCDMCGRKDHDVYVLPDGIARETCLNCGDSCSTVYQESAVRMLRKLYGEGT